MHATADLPVSALDDAAIERACAAACAAIAPAWPLDRAIAVNPHWGRIHRPLRQVAARMALLGGIQVFPDRATLRNAWDSGRISPHDLARAAAEHGLDLAACHAALREPAAGAGLQALPLLIDLLDTDPTRHTRLAWRQAVTHQVSQTCAAYFDRHQADWQPERPGNGLYAFWRATLMEDHGIGVLMGLPKLAQHLAALPATAQDAERWVLDKLGLPEAVWADYLEAVLLTVNGWASWCAYQGWQAQLEERPDNHLRELLAMRLAWGAVLLDAAGSAASLSAFAALQTAWRNAPAQLAAAEQALAVDETWQLALETGYQRQLAAQLTAPPIATVAVESPTVQAAFCIDVRSERLRRALEAACPTVQTIGCAGFFGLPIDYTPVGSAAARPQLPGLLAPALSVTDHASTTAATAVARRRRQQRWSWSAQWQAGSRWPGAAFSFVETAGIGALGQLASWLRPSTAPRERADLDGLSARQQLHLRPSLATLHLESKIDLAARILRALGLDHALAPLVLLVGHGSQSANNAQAAALDCGACCGQTGEVNARVLAELLSDAAVRAGLAQPAIGIAIPAATAFVAALHNTTTDELEWFDLDLLDGATRARLQAFQLAAASAGAAVRRERAPALGLDAHAAPARLLTQLRQRANDGAQTRPEWGLANNAAFIIASRARTRGLHLDGRSFLHDYDSTRDNDGSLLTALMTAPMLVTHWINWQYHASACDPQRLGSGNKLLHNVVGGHLGVFEGNGGDLRIGLSQQSLHDGVKSMHEALRLTVVIDAPAERIDAVIAQHQVVRQLVEHGWLHLWRIDDAVITRRTRQGWLPLDLP